MSGKSPKEAFTGIPGRTCRYTGSAAEGLLIHLADEELLSITPEQMDEIFSALAAHNPLEEECFGWSSAASAPPRRGPKRGLDGERRSLAAQYARLVSPRFMQWLDEHSVEMFGRQLTAEHAACIQGVFGGEGLLAMNGATPGDFPMAGLPDAASALVGRTVIYEENRRFAVVRVIGSGSSTDRRFLSLDLQNLQVGLISADFPGEFSVGGDIGELHLGAGVLGCNLVPWLIIAGPQTVCELQRIAGTGLDHRAFLFEHRRLVYGSGSRSRY